VTDARNHLYAPRIAHARVLLENDELSRQIEALTAKSSGDEQSGEADSTYSNKDGETCWELDQTRATKIMAEDRTQQIIARADELRANIEEARKKIAVKKEKISIRKSELATASKGFEKAWTSRIDEAERGIKMTQFRWNKLHVSTAVARAFLCSEAASLCDLRLRKIERDDLICDEYTLAGMRIMDLREMNSRSQRVQEVEQIH
jgi:hypothetical protein